MLRLNFLIRNSGGSDVHIQIFVCAKFRCPGYICKSLYVYGNVASPALHLPTHNSQVLKARGY